MALQWQLPTSASKEWLHTNAMQVSDSPVETLSRRLFAPRTDPGVLHQSARHLNAHLCLMLTMLKLKSWQEEDSTMERLFDTNAVLDTKEQDNLSCYVSPMELGQAECHPAPGMNAMTSLTLRMDWLSMKIEDTFMETLLESNAIEVTVGSDRTSLLVVKVKPSPMYQNVSTRTNAMLSNATSNRPNAKTCLDPIIANAGKDSHPTWTADLSSILGWLKVVSLLKVSWYRAKKKDMARIKSGSIHHWAGVALLILLTRPILATGL
jgi:hypothetical protein